MINMSKCSGVSLDVGRLPSGCVTGESLRLGKRGVQNSLPHPCNSQPLDRGQF